MDTEIDIWKMAYWLFNKDSIFIIAALIATGYIIRSMEAVPNRSIPLVNMVFGIVFTIWRIKLPIEGIMLGLIYAALSVGSYEMVVRAVGEKLQSFFGKTQQLVLVAGMSLLFIGCQTTPQQRDSNVAVFGQGSQVAAFGFSCWTLSLSKGDPQDLSEKEQILSDVVKYLKIARDNGFVGAQVASGLIDMVPASKEHWQVWLDNVKIGLQSASGPEAKAIVEGLIAGINRAKAAF